MPKSIYLCMKNLIPFIFVVFLSMTLFSCKKDSSTIYGKWTSTDSDYSYKLDIRKNAEAGDDGKFEIKGSDILWTRKNGDKHIFQLKEVTDDTLILAELIYIFENPEVPIIFTKDK